ncbi:MAG: relaxase/mobilization nuclease domain-containing protein [Ethanoligenens sp.]
MAISEIRPIKCWKGKSTAAVVKDRIDYYKDPDKTDGGRLVSCFQCSPDSAVEEFMTTKHIYKALTRRSREKQNDAVLWRICQSFKPGEVSPEEANEIGYAFAKEFLKGEHQFMVCTHIEKHHIHNHIVWNSVALDCEHKWDNYYHSAFAARTINDRLCKEHDLSVIQPKEKGKEYKEWDAEQKGSSWKEKLRETIDALLPASANFDDFLARMREAGYEVKTGKHLAFRAAGQKRFTRAKTLGEDYSEPALKARLEGKQRHNGAQKKAWRKYTRNVNLLIDIQAKIASGKGPGYERWAKVFNLKESARTMNYLMEHGIADYDTLVEHAKEATARYATVSTEIRKLESRMAEIAALRKHIINYSKTREVFKQYKASGYSAKFRAEHENELAAREAAKHAFDALHTEKLPTMAQLKQKYGSLLAEKREKYEESRRLKSEQYELQTALHNVDQILNINNRNREEQKNV